MERGLNKSLAACNLAMAHRPADQTDLPAQSVMDWRRSWGIALHMPDGKIHDLQVDPDGTQAHLKPRGEGDTQHIDIRPGQAPGSVARLALALGISPERTLRIATLLAQTELEPAEAVLATRSALSGSFGADAQASPVGGERIAVDVRIGSPSEGDTLGIQFDRDGRKLHSLSVTGPQNLDEIITLDTDQSFIQWQVQARIDSEGIAHVNPRGVRIEYSLVEKPD
jgi:hypothetical protein